MLSKRKKRKAFFKKHKRLAVLFICLALVLFAVRSFENKVSDFSKSYFPQFARQETAKCVSSAVERVLCEGNYSYNDFARIKYSGGRVSAIETNSANINAFKNKIVAAAEEQAERIHNSVMHIPLGAFTGLSLIANYGPKIPLSYCLTGSFSAELDSTFESSGINQTIHHIRLIVTSKIVTASVDFKDTLTFSTDYEIAQSVLVGNIPTTYGGYFTSIR